VSLLMTVATALTQDPPVDVDPGTGKGPEWGKAAPVGLLVILLMAIATFFLLRSMVRKINKVPASFDPPDEPDEAYGSDGATVDVVATDVAVPATLPGSSPDADPGSAGPGERRPGESGSGNYGQTR